MVTGCFLLIITLLPMIFVESESQATAANQTICYEVVNSPDKNPLWHQSGLDINVDG
jgi:hypothetical protein